MSLLDVIASKAIARGLDSGLIPDHPSGEDSWRIQQDPRELARLICVLAANEPFACSLEIGIASGGTTRFIREWVHVERTTVIDDGKHPDAGLWADHKFYVQGLSECLEDSHSDHARNWLSAYGGRFDLVGIDADHSYDGVMQDWEMIEPHLASGAIAWFHDIHCCPGVRKAWDEIVTSHEMFLEIGHRLGIGVLWASP